LLRGGWYTKPEINWINNGGSWSCSDSESCRAGQQNQKSVGSITAEAGVVLTLNHVVRDNKTHSVVDVPHDTVNWPILRVWWKVKTQVRTFIECPGVNKAIITGVVATYCSACAKITYLEFVICHLIQRI
jgi:hypothetical protein